MPAAIGVTHPIDSRPAVSLWGAGPGAAPDPRTGQWWAHFEFTRIHIEPAIL